MDVSHACCIILSVETRLRHISLPGVQFLVVTARDGEIGLDGRVRVVAGELDVFGLKLPKRFEIMIELHGRERLRFTRELLLNLAAVILVHVEIAECVDEFSRLASEYLCDDGGEKRVARDVEGNAEEYVGTALVELEADAALLDVDLIHIVADGEASTLAGPRHSVHVFGVPRCDERV